MRPVIRQKLVAMWVDAVGEIRGLETCANDGPVAEVFGDTRYSDDLSDLSSRTSNLERAFQFASLRSRTLDEIEAALSRLDAGVYGWCEWCRAPIAEARLDAMPTARICIECQRQSEVEARPALSRRWG